MIYQQWICKDKNCKDPNVCDCTQVTRCDEYTSDGKGNWSKIKERPAKDCHAILGVTSSDYTKLLNYSREMQGWFPNNCKMD